MTTMTSRCSSGMAISLCVAAPLPRRIPLSFLPSRSPYYSYRFPLPAIWKSNWSALCWSPTTSPAFASSRPSVHQEGGGLGIHVNFCVATFYKFVFVKEPELEVAKHLTFLQGRDIRGRIYMNEQGINAQVSFVQYSGPSEDMLAYAEWIKEDPRFSDILIQTSSALEGHAFPRLKVRYKPSLVQLEGGMLHLPVIDPAMRAAPLTPAEWQKKLQELTIFYGPSYKANGSDPDKKLLLLDMRNGYEWDVGHFEGAERPDVNSFRQTSIGLSEDKTASDALTNVDRERIDILMYCTGGIRCDIYSTILRQRGFQNLYTLHGGVSHYLTSKGSVGWVGNLFVFDSRLSMAPSSFNPRIGPDKRSEVVSENGVFARCYVCASPVQDFRHRNCANLDCNRLFLCCGPCVKDFMGCCCPDCTKAPRLRPVLPGHQRILLSRSFMHRGIGGEGINHRLRFKPSLEYDDMGLSKPLIFLLVSCLLCCFSSVFSTQVSYNGRAIVINGQRRVLFSGSIHYPRSTPEMWADLINKAKEGGLDAIETYVFWNGHEPQRRQYNFEGNFDLVRFIKEVQNAGLYAVLRIGPYVCAEWNYGGLPAWLRQIPGMEMRTNNQPFKDEMQNFTTLIVNMLKQERLFAPQGGPIILTQIENEYGNVEGPYGQEGKMYINWCAQLAESYQVGVPWIMCQQDDAPQPMINTCNGFYCDQFTPNSRRSPKMWTENWTGWFKAWDKPDPHRLAEDLAFSVARFFQSSGTFQNYYMYHGGTNFGRTTGGPYITTTYDYDAPLDEYGNIRQPKWGHLRNLHISIKKMEHALTFEEQTRRSWEMAYLLQNSLAMVLFPAASLANKNTTADATLEFEGNKYFLPAWSISVLPDCKQEVYNTAKVNVQTSVMVKRPNQAEKEPENLIWSWKKEDLTEPLLGLGADFTANTLNDQILSTADASDYLWYMTSVDDIPESKQMILYVNTTGHILHAFVNGKLNYGPYYELMPAGIVGGPVQLIGSNNDTIDLSTNKWSYKIGLLGEKEQMQLDNSTWNKGGIPTKTPFTWYKTTFQAPLGSEAVVVDLLGMGKGAAWVNGQSIGRFWPNYTASYDGCHPCDYRGSFQSDACQTGCGEPAQRWYHVPRSFLKSGEPNSLVLFEEAGGDPSRVNFQTVTVGTVCANVTEGNTLTLSCQDSHNIAAIQFASFGNPQGDCGSFEVGSCDADGVLALVKQV
ncbi:hypothetical protein HPP92_004718 [Vanilla planifolia]|uniref:Beta-galactosidase n=1 Tax=Vanilla planifolia TaxID=51239 RepID=A0A835RQV7_VANPL|nr:hypothetical protein HPP92_004718 [Vanilla planifolia]